MTEAGLTPRDLMSTLFSKNFPGLGMYWSQGAFEDALEQLSWLLAEGSDYSRKNLLRSRDVSRIEETLCPLSDLLRYLTD
ncbi:MAG: hypothetical protein H0U23_07500 [Blastocatellia bacterium]|nr:hypothetical protein [Blastocatellia bacterium]